MPADLDGGTRAIIDALARPGADLLYALLMRDAATERELTKDAAASQATANRRLRRLEELMIVQRQGPDRAHAPNRRWRLRHPEAVRQLLFAATTLADEAARSGAEVRRTTLDRLQPPTTKLHQLRRPNP
ncbi:MAG TPA: hypothetical protein VFU94_13190 [Conexibacter sp.]|nr:hypothetical protein [Conexibacter sp.]